MMGDLPSLNEAATNYRNPQKSLCGVKVSKRTDNCLRISGFSSFYPSNTVFSLDFTKSRSFGILLLLLRAKIRLFGPSNYRFFTAPAMRFPHNNWILKTQKKSTFSLWTHGEITAQILRYRGSGNLILRSNDISYI